MLVFKIAAETKVLKEQGFTGELAFDLGLESALQRRRASQAEGTKPTKSYRLKCLQFIAPDEAERDTLYTERSRPGRMETVAGTC